MSKLDTSNIDIYLVGGAVRDGLLGKTIRERDWVVVGATEDEMRAAGFRPVGRDFPVFLHPETQEEYALARTERKTGPGHQGFVCHASPDVTLEQDLERRDLTINAIARDSDGTLIDPYGGQRDIEDRLLRHVSAAFAEDPLRILRVARFAATLPAFEVHPETISLMQRMINEGGLAELTPERVLLELDKALAAESPATFFDCLERLGANQQLWPELDGEAVNRLRLLESRDPDARFAVLLQSLDEAAINRFCDRYRTSNQRRELARLVATRLQAWQSLTSLDPAAVVEFLVQTDALRKRDRFVRFNEVCKEITGLNPDWLRMLEITASVKASDVDAGITGRALGEAIRARQIELISRELT